LKSWQLIHEASAFVVSERLRQMQAGKMALPRFAPWLAAFEAELFQFPDTAHDDQVDAVSQYLNWIRKKTGQDSLRVRRL
jgi:phage terminase large subunit-like protein